MKRALLVALLACAGCIDWAGAREKFFADGGTAGGSSAGGGMAMGGGAATGGGGGAGGGVASAGDGGIQCEKPARWAVWVQARILALATSQRGVEAAGSFQGDPYLTTLGASGAAFTLPGARRETIRDVAVSADGHRWAAIGDTASDDGGTAQFIAWRTDDMPIEKKVFPTNFADELTLTGVAFQPGHSDVAYVSATHRSNDAVPPFNSDEGAQVVSLDLNSLASMASLIASVTVRGEGCEISDVDTASLPDGGLGIYGIGRGGATQCYWEEVDSGVTNQRFLLSATQFLNEGGLVQLGGPAVTPWQLPDFRDRISVVDGGGGTITTFAPQSGADIVYLYTVPNPGSHNFEYSGSPLYASSVSVASSGRVAMGGLVKHQTRGTFGAVWRFTEPTFAAASVEIQSCTNAVVTAVEMLPDGGVNAAAAIADGGDLTLVMGL